MDTIRKREGMKFIKEFPADEPVVSMTTFHDTVFVATTKAVYEVVDKINEDGTYANTKALAPIEIVVRE